MKQLLNGVAIAAALVIAAPVWALAQTPAAQGPRSGPTPRVPSSAPAAAAAPAAMPAAAPMTAQRHKRMHHMGHAKTGPGDASTEQLNREELARLQGGGAPAAAPPPPPASQGPRTSGH
jgi:hypothetical protein